jgi:hypothetical protein
VGTARPILDLGHRFIPGQVLICPVRACDPHGIRRWADQGLTVIGTDLVPATFSPDHRHDASSADYADLVIALLTRAHREQRPEWRR